MIGTNGGCFPPPIVSTRIALVELKAAVFVPPGVQHGNAKRSHATELGVALFGVTDASDQLIHGDWFLVLEEVALGLEAAGVDEDVGVGGDAGDGTGDVIVDLVHFFTTNADCFGVKKLFVCRDGGEIREEEACSVCATHRKREPGVKND